MKKIKKDVFDTERIKNRLKDMGLSKAKFCKTYNFSLNTLNSILNQKLKISTTKVFLLSKKLNIEFKDLFKK